MADELTFAALQLQSQADVAENLRAARSLAERARARGAQVLLLPENFAFFGSEQQKRTLAESLDESGPIVTALRELSRSLGLYVIAGGFPERTRDPERPHNTCWVLAPDGSELARYRKIHLFDVELGASGSYRESAATLAGDEPVVCDVLGFRIGLSICYDLRFPELYRRLAARGADVVVVPAAFTLHTGKDHWHPLLRARAIENQCYVVAAAQQGSHPNNRNTYGHSLVVDPWGTVVADAPDGPGVVHAVLEKSRLDSVRRSLPCLTHRRL